MSEAAQARPSGAWLAHAAEVAHWVVMLLGWLWLGEQGMRLGWSWASGVLPVALWWAVRIVCRGQAWCARSPVMGLCGLFTALGLALPAALSDRASAHGALLLLAALWGVWSALIETRRASNTFLLGAVAWHPLLAAGLILPVLQVSPFPVWGAWGAVCLLATAAVLLSAQGRFAAPRAQPLAARADLGSAAPSAMGVMMGTLWLSGSWCAGLGWPMAHIVWAHVGLMTVLPVLLSLLVQVLPLGRVFLQHHSAVCVGLMALGAWALLGNSAQQHLLAMVLFSLAWALHCIYSGMGAALPQRLAPPHAAWPLRRLALLLGPLLLCAVGVAAPRAGPAALQAALFALGVLAAVGLVWKLWQRSGVHKPVTAITSH